MASLHAIREQRRKERIDVLRLAVSLLISSASQQQVWLFGSLARGDWDAYSDVDLLAVAADQPAAEALADALREADLADDVLALSEERWRQRQSGVDSAMTPRLQAWLKQARNDLAMTEFARGKRRRRLLRVC